MAESLNPTVFHRRMNRLMAHWKASSKGGAEVPYNGADVLAIVVGKANDDVPYAKSVALHNWLFDGLEMPDTLILVTRTEAIFMASTKKAALLSALKGVGSNPVPMKVVERQKADTVASKFDQILATLKDVSKVGLFPKELTSDPFHTEWTAALQRRSLEQVDITLGIGLLLAVKDDDELRDEKRSGEATSLLLRNFVVDRIETVIDQGDQITHAKLADEIDKAIGDEKIMRKKIKLPDEIQPDLIDSCYLPIIQSGGVYELKPSALSNDDNLHFGTIVVSVGLRYKGFCTNIARTFLIDATPEQDENYSILVELHARTVKLMSDGAKLSDVYAGSLKFLEERKPALKEYLTKNLGFGTGLEFREPAYVINEKCARELAPGMVVNLFLGFQNIPNPDAKSDKDKLYSLLLGDTVQVTAAGARVLTNYKTSLDDVSYKLQDDDGAGGQTGAAGSGAGAGSSKDAKAASDVLLGAGAPGSKVVRSRTRGEEKDESVEAARREHQKELFEARQRQNLKRFQKNAPTAEEDPADVVRKVEAYKNATGIPREVKPNQIYVDSKRDAVIMPIYGSPVPFHIATIKGVSLSKAEDGDYANLRVQFNLPGQGATPKADAMAVDGQPPTYIRELMFRALDARNFTDATNKIKELIKTYKTREAERREKESLVVLEELVAGKGRLETLPDIMVRPSPDNKRVLGTVEIHENGLRYRSNKGNRIDVPFSNIRHLIYQPCKTKEVITILHVHLKNPIIVGNKKTKDVQFFREVVDDAAEETSGRKRDSAFDPDEIESEERERRQRKAHDRDFKAFGLKIAEKSNGLVELEATDRELGFDGVPVKSMVLIQPTTHALVHLTEMPFTVITLDDVELVSLERVQHGNRNFDMIFVFKDFKRAPMSITTIDMKQLPNLVEFLEMGPHTCAMVRRRADSSMDLPFAESRMNMKWTQILKTINDDTAGFFEDGGWKNVVDVGSEDELAAEEDEEDEDESESSYAASEDESDESEDDSDDYEDEDEDEDEEDEEDESEDEGKDWDELERDAEEEEKRKRRGDDDEEERRPPKKSKK